MATYSEQELDGLSEAELQAIKELEQDELDNQRHKNGEGGDDDATRLNAEEQARLAAEARAADDAKKQAEEKARAEAEQKAKEDAEKKAKEEADADPDAKAKAEEQAAAEAAAKKTETKTVETPKPLFDAKPVEDFDKKITDIKSQKEAVAKKLEEGDLTYAEYHAEIEKLNDSEMDLKLAQSRYELARDSQKQQSKNAWETACDAFMNEHPEYTSKIRFNAINALVIELAGDDKNIGLSGPELLAKAHEMVEAELGPAPGKKQADPTKDKKTVELPDAPTLNRLPAAEHNEASENRFAYLEKLSGEDYEAALKKLSPADYEAFMKA